MNIRAHVPTQQYGFVEIDGGEEDLERIKTLYNDLAEKKVAWGQSSAGGVFKQIETFTGETVFFNETDHIYKDSEGNALVSGSQYAEQFSKPFDKQAILPRTAKAWGMDEQTISDMWDGLADISTTFGTAVHKALEIMHVHHASSLKAKNDDSNYLLDKMNPTIKDIVEQFIDKFGVHDTFSEIFVSDVANRRVGQIDRLLITDLDDKTCRVQDYKTNGELKKDKIDTYAHQLSFYAKCLEAHGWEVEGIDLYHWSNKWTLIELTKQPVTIL